MSKIGFKALAGAIWFLLSAFLTAVVLNEIFDLIVFAFTK